MNKDAILATLIGFGIGLIITGSILLGPKFFARLSSLSWPKLSLPKTKYGSITPIAPTPVPIEFTIDNPLPEAISSSINLQISGKAPPGSTTVIQGEIDDQLAVVSNEGDYSAEITLREGKNDIVVANYKDKVPTEKTVTVYFTPEKI